MPDYGMPAAHPPSRLGPVQVLNEGASSRIVLVCDHASNRMPHHYGGLGLEYGQKLTHVAWDPGALSLAKALMHKLDAVLVHSAFSRLLADPNRYPDQPALIPSETERGPIPGNADVSDKERADRIAQLHQPYHAKITEVLDRLVAQGIEPIVVAVHSFTPVFDGNRRPWPVGLIQARDPAFSQGLFEALKHEMPGEELGWNLPYGPLPRTYYTPDIHMDARGLHGTVLEVRNDGIRSPSGVNHWCQILARSLNKAASEV